MQNIIAASAALLALAGGQANAHAMLKSAVPAVGSTIAAAPPEVALSFSEEVEPKFSSIVVQDAAGHPVQSGAAHLAAGDAAQLVVGLPALKAGVYKVIWHATAVDTHKTQGSFGFTVKP